MLTPMQDEGRRVDIEGAGRLAAWLVDRGVHGLYIAGTTGEGLYLSSEEFYDLTRAVVKAAKGLTVVAHVGALTTAQAVALAQRAVLAEVTAVAAIPPPYYSLTRAELLAHCTAVARAAEPLPFYLYNIPSHARNDLPPALVAELREAIPTLAGIKDSSGFAGRIPELVKTLGRDFGVICGNDDKVFHALEAGAAGIVASGASLFPELYLGLHAAWTSGQIADAQGAQARIIAMQQALGSGAHLGWYKYALSLRGVPVGGVRAPLLDPTAADQARIRNSLRELRLL
jgi:4-hydroxy-tetrahydrodipicolinate synthase